MGVKGSAWRRGVKGVAGGHKGVPRGWKRHWWAELGM